MVEAFLLEPWSGKTFPSYPSQTASVMHRPSLVPKLWAEALMKIDHLTFALALVGRDYCLDLLLCVRAGV